MAQHLHEGWLGGWTGRQWAMNSSGIVETSGETYILSVYTQHQPTIAGRRFSAPPTSPLRR